MAMTPEVKAARAAARQAAWMAQVAEHVERLVAEAPPLTQGQIERLRVIFGSVWDQDSRASG